MMPTRSDIPCISLKVAESPTLLVLVLMNNDASCPLLRCGLPVAGFSAEG